MDVFYMGSMPRLYNEVEVHSQGTSEGNAVAKDSAVKC
jgi:hypothetical protein